MMTWCTRPAPHWAARPPATGRRRAGAQRILHFMREIAQQFAVRLDLLDQAMTAIGQHALLDLARLDQHGPALARQPDGRDRHFHRFHGAAQERQLPDVGIAAAGGDRWRTVCARGCRTAWRPTARTAACATARTDPRRRRWRIRCGRARSPGKRTWRAGLELLHSSQLPIALRATRNARNQHNSIENAAEPAKPARSVTMETNTPGSNASIQRCSPPTARPLPVRSGALRKRVAGGTRPGPLAAPLEGNAEGASGWASPHRL